MSGKAKILILKEERYRSRPHHKDEKKKQKKEWEKRRKEEKRKRKREEKKGKRCGVRGEPTAVRPRQIHASLLTNKRKAVDDIVEDTVMESNLPPEEHIKKLKKQEQVKKDEGRKNVAVSATMYPDRGRKMLAMAKLKRPELSNQSPRVFNKLNGLPVKDVGKTISKLTKNPTLTSSRREIDPSLVVKISDEPIGSGTFGDVFLAEYRGVKTVVKQMKRRNGHEWHKETERCRQEVIHEANVLHSLGDHPNLPFLFGTCTKNEPFSLVLQFYGTGKESLTLHKVLKKRMLNLKLTAKVFKDIADTLQHIHSKGFLHNDLKTDNVIIHRGHANEFCPIIIDFGKCKKQVNVEGYKRRTDAYYIAPEVKSGEPESTASDLYSFGKMLEGAVAGRSFCSLFSDIISNTTAPIPSQRPSAKALSLLLTRLSTEMDTKH